LTLKTDKNRRESQVKAWDAAASNQVFFQPTSWEEDPFLQQIQREVHLSPEMKVLDIGCGGGRYALALAERVGHVVGIDVSPKMIENAREWAEKMGVTNVEYRVGDFPLMKRVDIPGSFDLIFAHMTPAVMDMEDFALLRSFAGDKDTSFYIVKPLKRKGHVDETILVRLGREIKEEKFDALTEEMFCRLWEEGLMPSIVHRKDRWTSEKTVDESMEWIFERLKAYQNIGEEKRETVRGYLEDMAQEGLIKEEVDVIITTLGWKEERR
jgi:SAM-dependent methyltransferase